MERAQARAPAAAVRRERVGEARGPGVAPIGAPTTTEQGAAPGPQRGHRHPELLRRDLPLLVEQEVAERRQRVGIHVVLV